MSFRDGNSRYQWFRFSQEKKLENTPLSRVFHSDIFFRLNDLDKDSNEENCRGFKD